MSTRSALGFVMSTGLAALSSLALAGAQHPPKRPSNGAPVAVVVDKLGTDSLAVRAYNFSDKTIGGISLRIRYYDKTGKPAPTDDNGFEYEAWSGSGTTYVCAPKKWCSFSIEHLKIPAGTTKAEIRASEVLAMKADGTSVDNATPLFSSPFTKTWGK